MESLANANSEHKSLLLTYGGQVWCASVGVPVKLTNFIEGLPEVVQVVPGNLCDVILHRGFCLVYLKHANTHSQLGITTGHRVEAGFAGGERYEASRAFVLWIQTLEVIQIQKMILAFDKLNETKVDCSLLDPVQLSPVTSHCLQRADTSTIHTHTGMVPHPEDYVFDNKVGFFPCSRRQGKECDTKTQTYLHKSLCVFLS